jgi:mannose-6-phosphate isomerase-like protein (cupin superfamily)
MPVAPARTVARVGDSFLLMSEVFTFLVTSAESNGRLCAVHGIIPPGGSGPGQLHTHEADEIFHVIKGSLVIVRGEPGCTERIDLHAGETSHVAGNVPHLFRNAGEIPTEVLFSYSPAPPQEAFFLAGGLPIADPDNPPEVDVEDEIRRVLALLPGLGMRLYDTPVDL